jgi:predicted ATPase
MRTAAGLGPKDALSLEKRINEIMHEQGNCVIAVSGSPGSGKSTIAARVKEEGFLSFGRDTLFVVDDLRGPNGERYSRRDIKKLSGTIPKRILMLFDYRAALYLKRADMCFILRLDEDERIRNLQQRSARSFKKYRNKWYGIPPIPFSFKKEKVFSCSKTFFYDNGNS